MKNNLIDGMTLGADPELMLFDNKKGRIVSSIPVVGRDKHDPVDLGDGIRMYADNVLVEVAFPPANNKGGFIETIRTAIARMSEALGAGFRLLPKTSHVYPESELRNKKAVESGCNENFDVYGRTKGPPPPFNGGLRTGSFHVHIGHNQLLDPRNKDRMVRLLDIYLGCASIVFDNDETSHARRSLYGKAGEFRPTPYGVEYRVLGNFALRSPRVTELVVDLVQFSVDKLISGQADKIIGSIDQANVQNAINSNMRGLAKSVLKSGGLDASLFSGVNKTYKPSCSIEAWL